MASKHIRIHHEPLPLPVSFAMTQKPIPGGHINYNTSKEMCSPFVKHHEPDLYGYGLDDMRRLFLEMKHIDPVHWRHREDFCLENPIHFDDSGNRVLRLQFDLRQFKPEEITLKTVGHLLTVHAKHEDKRDGKTSTREYSRQFVLPNEVDPDTIHSKLTYGVLTVEAPMPKITIIS